MPNREPNGPGKSQRFLQPAGRGPSRGRRGSAACLSLPEGGRAQPAFSCSTCHRRGPRQNPHFARPWLQLQQPLLLMWKGHCSEVTVAENIVRLRCSGAPPQNPNQLEERMLHIRTGCFALTMIDAIYQALTQHQAQIPSSHNL